MIYTSFLNAQSSSFREGGRKYMQSSWDDVATFVIDLEHITGKKGTP
ncbi:hypothetical protein OCV59_07595 [Brotomerdimonas butyrica]|nr:hypothetical protein [Brotomerdimonas butyrica]